MIPRQLTEHLRYRINPAHTGSGGLEATEPDLWSPWRGPFLLNVHMRVQEASPTGKHHGRIFRLLTPPVPVVRMLTESARRPAQPTERRRGGRLAANGYIDPYVVRRGGPSGLVAPDFRFIP